MGLLDFINEGNISNVPGNAGAGSESTFISSGTLRQIMQDVNISLPVVIKLLAAGDWNGVRGTDDTGNIRAALTAGIAAGRKIFDFGDASYKISLIEGTPLFTFTNQTGIRIKGAGKIHDSTIYTNTAVVTAIFNFDACSDCKVDFNYEGIPLPSPDDPSNGIGYQGATWVNLKNGCTDIEVNGKLTDLRYGVRSGNYAVPSEGFNKHIKTKLSTIRCGYQIAHYLGEDIDHDGYSESGHRTVYLAGVVGFTVNARFMNNHIAPVQVLLTDATTNGGIYPAGTSRGCSAGKIWAKDMGSTSFVANSWCVGISPSRVDSGTVYEDIDVHVYVKSSDTIASTLGAFMVDSSAKVFEASYPFNWESYITLRNITVSGTVDRSLQTIAEHGTGEIYFSTTDTNTAHFATITGVTIKDYQYISGSGSQPRGHWFINLGLTGQWKFDNCNFGSVTAITWKSNPTSLTLFENCSLIGTFPTASDSPTLSAQSFNNCNGLQMQFQPLTNRTFINTLVQGGGGQTKRLLTDLALSGASNTWANSLPNNSMVKGVSGIVTVAITGSTGYQVGDGTTVGRFRNTNNVAQGDNFGPGNSTDAGPFFPKGTGSIVVTSKVSNFVSGTIRLFVDYELQTPPTL